ncbi:MAG: 4-coumarate--CoA ligase family protein [Ardenticatenaceae bacterium]
MIYRSPYSDVEIPEISLTDFVFQHAGQDLDKPALIDGPTGRTITFGQLIGGSRKMAAGLAQRGFGKGDVFAIYSPNVPEYAIAFFGTTMIGGVVTTVNPLYTAGELTHQLNDSGARFLLTIPMFLDKALEAAEKSGVEEVFVFGEAEGATPFVALLNNDGQVPEVEINPRDDLAVLPYSSGTTGRSKGVMLTHYNLVANMTQCEDLDQFTSDDVAIGILPFYHIYGMVVIMSFTLGKGATVVSMPRFDLVQFLEVMEKYSVTAAYVVPPIVLALAKHPIIDNYSFPKLRFVNSGAAPMPEPVANACAQRLDCVVKQGYGMTELSPVSHATAITFPIKVTAVGPVIANTESRIVDVATGEDVEPGQSGEIWVRGPQVMKGYHNRPDATAATIDEEGWLHTGDIGYVDEDEYFYVIDRVKELIKYKGFQVAPAELESLIQSHPAVADVAVIPSPDEEAGEVPKAFIMLKPGSSATAEQIMGFVATRVAPHKKIRRVEFIDAIPKVPSGKILRRKLVERERAAVAAAS